MLSIQSPAQQRLEQHAVDTTVLDGFFILYRKETIQVDIDHTEPKDTYQLLFVKHLNSEMLSNFLYLDLDSETVDVADSWERLDLVTSQKEDSAFAIFRDRNFNWYDRNATPFLFLKDVPPHVMNGDNRFIAVYEGEMRAIGPFNVVGSIVRRDSFGYFYIKDPLDKVKYLYSIVFPLLQEEMENLYPHAIRIDRKQI